MKKGLKIAIVIFLVIDVVLFVKFLLMDKNVMLFNPQGTIALQESYFIRIIGSLMILAASSVIAITFLVAWKYRATNKKAKYNPDWTGNRSIKIVWWTIPISIIFVLAIVTWIGTHALDPYKPIRSNIQPITIQVVALNWKWLFIYPEQNIATVNYVQFPVNTPIHFELTADAPMNSFWIPQLGGQMYAMAGMQNQLHLLANNIGTYNGSEVEINGSGFAGMRFVAKVTSKDDFDNWSQSVQMFTSPLDLATYNKLAKPSENTPVLMYSPVENNLFNEIIDKYMIPVSPSGSQMENMDMKGMKM